MKKSFILLMLFAGITPLSLMAKQITTILFDIESIFESDDMKASGYIGKFNALKYIAKTGHKPSQEELFKQLKNVKSLSTEYTYNGNLEMPLIFSDWLAQKQPNSKIIDHIQKYLATNKKLADIEVTVLTAIISMMLTPEHLADIQKVLSKVENILKALQQKGYKIYLVGNWAHINSLKSKFNDIFKYFQAATMSGDIHLLKPSRDYYEKVLEMNNIKADQALWIETEPKFASKAKQYGYNAALVDKNTKSITSALNNFGIVF